MRNVVPSQSLSRLTSLRNLAALGAIVLLSGCNGTGAPPPDGSDGEPPPSAQSSANSQKNRPEWAIRLSELNDRMEQSDQSQRGVLTDINNRLALLERQMGILQGTVEEVRHNQKMLTERIDLLPQPEVKSPAHSAQEDATIPTVEIQPPPPATPTTAAAAPAATKTVAAVPAPAKPGSATPPAPSSKQPANAKEAYDAAFDMLKQGQYDPSQTAFQNFLKTYPKDAMADNAQYWIGELHYVQRRFPEALMAFNQVLLRWPNSLKVPDALLKIGFSFYELNDMENANSSLQRLIKDFPTSSPATVAKPRLVQIKQKLGR